MSNFFHRGNPNQAAENLKRIWQDSDDQENEMIFEKISSDNESSDHQSSLKFSSKFENHKATRQLSSKRRRNVIEISESSEDEANTELGQKKTNSQGSIRCRKESVINVARIRSKNNIIDCENFESINDESCIPNTRIDEVNLVDVDCTQMPNNNKDQEYSDIREVEEKILKHQKMLEKVCNSVLSKECTSTVTKSLDKDMDIPSLVTVVIIDRFSYYSGDKNSDKGHSSTYTVDSHDNLLSIYQRHCEKMRLNLRGKILTCEGRKLYMSMTAISLAAKYPDCTLHIGN